MNSVLVGHPFEMHFEYFNMKGSSKARRSEECTSDRTNRTISTRCINCARALKGMLRVRPPRESLTEIFGGFVKAVAASRWSKRRRISTNFSVRTSSFMTSSRCGWRRASSADGTRSAHRPFNLSIFFWYSTEQRNAAGEDHRAIAEVLEQQDGERAEALMMDHILGARDVVLGRWVAFTGGGREALE
jgi:hypothetical protein